MKTVLYVYITSVSISLNQSSPIIFKICEMGAFTVYSAFILRALQGFAAHSCTPSGASNLGFNDLPKENSTCG